MQTIALIALLAGALLAIVALVVWQEARRRPAYEPLEYVVDDAVRHIVAHLPEQSSLDKRLDKRDVRRILEWEVFYLQGLAQDDRRNPVETVAGGHDASVAYIGDEIEAKHGVAYSHEDINNVLRLEADYLVAIGAVGEPVDLGEEE